MRHFRNALTCIALCCAFLAATAVAAPNLVGVWKGRVSVDTTHMPTYTSPQQAKIARMRNERAVHKIWTLTIKNDHTFTLIDSDTKRLNSGKWFLTGNVVSLDHDRRSEKLTLSKNARMLTIKAGILTFSFKKS